MIRQRKSTGEWCLPLADFKRLDYGRVCQMLGLRPSKPYRPARKGGKR